MIDWPAVQRRLGVSADGVPGPATYAALLRKMGAAGATLAPLAKGCALAFGGEFATIGERPLRLAHWLGQMAHESGGFRFLREIWGPTPAQARYEGRANLGNTQPGDGKRFMGRGLVQLTGRDNYRRYGKLSGLPLESQPDLASVPENAVRLACLYWQRSGLNTLADGDDVRAITRIINGGSNGLEDRIDRTVSAKRLLGT